MNHITSSLALGLTLALAACDARTPAGDAQPGDAPTADARAPSARSATASSTRDDALVIGSWNIEWFGDPSNGPGNEPLQLANATTTLRDAHADVWGLAEIVDDAQWQRLVQSMPGYAGMLASDPRVRGGARAYSATEQKLAVLYRTDAVAVRGARLVLTDHDADFAGRPPLEVRFATKHGAAHEFTVIVLHMKARSDDASWSRRERAARALKTFLDTEHPNDAVLVVGDWNDGVERSITVGRPSPYAELAADRAHYRFTSQALLLPGQSRGNAMLVDHHLATNEFADVAAPRSAEIIRPDPSIRNFRSTTSDHFPVVSHFRSVPP